MEFKEFCRERKRMCKKAKYCDNCELGNDNNTNMFCEIYCMNHPNKAEKIVSEWVKEHPIVTNRDKFKEVFGFDIDITAGGSILLYINDYISEEDWLVQEYKPPQK